MGGTNPFEGVDFFLSPRYASRVHSSVRVEGGSASALGSKMERAAGIPTAVWIDTISAIADMRATLAAARVQQQGTGVRALCVFVVYNLPGRDCGAAASAGELRTGEIARYRSQFIAPLAAVAAEYDDVPQVFVLEPDSLPNLVTNMGRSHCAAAANEYKEGIAHAIQTLGTLGTVYVDAGWSGWIGTWAAGKMAQILQEIFELAGADAARRVRGFVLNTSNYGSVAAEAAYAAALRTALQPYDRNLAYVVDTGRSGGTQSSSGTWCNPKGGAMGPVPEASPASAAYADAFFWLKPPVTAAECALEIAADLRLPNDCLWSLTIASATRAGGRR